MLRTLGRFTDPRQFEELGIAILMARDSRADMDASKTAPKSPGHLPLNGVHWEPRHRRQRVRTRSSYQRHKRELPRLTDSSVGCQAGKISRSVTHIESALLRFRTHLVIGGILASLVVLLSCVVALDHIARCDSGVADFEFAMMRRGLTLKSVTMLAWCCGRRRDRRPRSVGWKTFLRFNEEKKAGRRGKRRRSPKGHGSRFWRRPLARRDFMPVVVLSAISGRFFNSSVSPRRYDHGQPAGSSR